MYASTKGMSINPMVRYERFRNRYSGGSGSACHLQLIRRKWEDYEFLPERKNAYGEIVQARVIRRRPVYRMIVHSKPR